MQFAGRFAPWKVTNGAENLVLQALQFRKIGFCSKLPGGADIGQYNALWRVTLTLVFI